MSWGRTLTQLWCMEEAAALEPTQSKSTEVYIIQGEPERAPDTQEAGSGVHL